MITIQADEKDIEDILSARMKRHLGLKFLQRQVRTPAGIIDMLARGEEKNVYYVIELKKGEINPYTLVQALRYTMYLNSNLSKDGKRIFIPVLIGDSLNKEMERSVVYLPDGGGDLEGCLYSAYYRIFDFDPDRGISFTFMNTAQERYEEEHLSTRYGYYTAKDEEASYQNWRLYEENLNLKARLNDQDNVVSFPSAEVA